MKKFTLVLCCLTVFQFANAQVSTGSIFTGGSVGFSSSKNEDPGGNTSKISQWSFSPQIGKAIQQNKILGVQLFISKGRAVNDNGIGGNIKTNNNAYGLGIFYRQYFPIYNKWMFFGQAGLSGNIGNGSTTNQAVKTAKNNSWTSSFGITPGITYQAGKKIWLEFSLNDLLNLSYNHQKTESINSAGAVLGTSQQNNFSAGANINGTNSLNIGLRWILPNPTVVSH